MYLNEFINLRKDCPMCGTALITKLETGRKQKIRLENNRFTAVMIMRGMRSCEPDYEVGYSFDLHNNSLSIEFYNEWDMKSCATKYMCDLFKKFHGNIKNRWYFNRACDLCFKYEMSSAPIEIDLHSATYSSVELSDESFVWDFPVDNEHRFVFLENYFKPEPASELCWWRGGTDHRVGWAVPSSCSVRKDLPVIPFVSKEETGARIGNLIIFS